MLGRKGSRRTLRGGHRSGTGLGLLTLFVPLLSSQHAPSATEVTPWFLILISSYPTVSWTLPPPHRLA